MLDKIVNIRGVEMYVRLATQMQTKVFPTNIRRSVYICNQSRGFSHEKNEKKSNDERYFLSLTNFRGENQNEMKSNYYSWKNKRK